METFLEAVEEGDYRSAAQVLDLDSYDPADQPLVGPRLARRLNILPERKAIVSWSGPTL